MDCHTLMQYIKYCSQVTSLVSVKDKMGAAHVSLCHFLWVSQSVRETEWMWLAIWSTILVCVPARVLVIYWYSQKWLWPHDYFLYLCHKISYAVVLEISLTKLTLSQWHWHWQARSVLNVKVGLLPGIGNTNSNSW